MTQTMSTEERALLAGVVANLSDDLPKLVYADWLEERSDPRSPFLRAYVKAAKTMKPRAFPKATGMPEEWLELIGYNLLKRCADKKFPELRDRVLRVARPALRMIRTPSDDKDVPVGASKIGGLPDLPPDYSWPPGKGCRAIYNADTARVNRLAGFVAQVNFAEIAHTQAARDVPDTGLLSFFCFQDGENDNPDLIGAKADYFPDVSRLARTEPPKPLTRGNEPAPVERLTFTEILDIPDAYSGPWSQELRPDPSQDYAGVFDVINDQYSGNVLGYARGTSGDDPTPTKESRHLIELTNPGGCRLHIQISQADLAARRFDRITLNWVDFD